MSVRPSYPPRGRCCLRCASLTLSFTLLTMLHPSLFAERPETDVQVRDAWIRWLPGGLPAAGYLTLISSSATPLELTAAASSDYAVLQLHESYSTVDGTARMRQVDKLRLPPHGEVRLAPGGYHLMLMKPTRSVRVGDIVTIKLTFEDGESVQARAQVKPASYHE